MILKSSSFSKNGTCIFYHYEYDDYVSQYFNHNSPFFVQYNEDVSLVPSSINIIPFLSNVMPIAWFAGFDVYVDEIDKDFYFALLNIKKEFIKNHPSIIDKKAEIKYKKLIKNDFPKEKIALLFSGGVDAFASFFRLYQKEPSLITIHGADIDLEDEYQWNNVVQFNENEPILSSFEKVYIKSNFRTFYTYKVDLLLPNMGWWGNIQHGLALTGVIAPLSYIKKYSTIYIASTRSVHMEFNPWGSMPEIDNQIKWSSVNVFHDGFELKRQDKVDIIVSAVNQLDKKTTIRVCYSELKEGLNCSKCEKCLRTIFGIMLSGDNPNKYGFKVDDTIYNLINKTVVRGFKSKGTQFFWNEILEKSKSAKCFVFSNADLEKKELNNTMEIISKVVNNDLISMSKIKKIKYILINKFPKIFSTYLKMRRKI